MNTKIIVVGGVAGGANFAARARRLNEKAEIIVVERSGYVSFANCGLPYHIGGEIEDRDDLLLHSPLSLKARFNLDVRIRTEATKINPQNKTIDLIELDSGRKYIESYDELVLAPGANPIIPPIPGITSPGIFTLRNIEEMDKILCWMKEKNPKRAVVIGGGFIGLEVLEQLKKKIDSLTLVEAAPQLLIPLDPEMAGLAEKEVRAHGVEIVLGDALASFEDPLTVVTASGRKFPSDMVILAIGVRPEVSLAKTACVELGPRGGIKVDSFLRTSVPHIWAVGDAIEIQNQVTGEFGVVPLAGLANRQGRIVADNIFGVEKRSFSGALGTAILRVFSLTAATTGANEKTLKRLNKKYKTLLLFPNSHAGYYPGAQELAIKLLFCPGTRKLLGAQVVGKDGVDKRIDVLATALKAKMSVDELSELELSYAPPFGSAKDPVNMAGMIAKNILDHLVKSISPEELLKNKENYFILDVRSKSEVDRGAISGHYWIPLPELRGRISELPKDKPILAYCQSAQRSYYASRILIQNGFNVTNLSGAYKGWLLQEAVLS